MQRTGSYRVQGFAVVLNYATVLLVALMVVFNMASFAPTASAKVITGVVKPSVAADPQKIGYDKFELVLTIHGKNPNDEVPLGSLPPGPLDGYVFTVQRVRDIDVRSSEGYELAASMTVSAARSRGFSFVTQGVSNSSGEARFSGLDAGLYLIDTSAPDRTGFAPLEFAPILVILPVSDDGGNWLPSVTVHLKEFHHLPPPPIVPPTEHRPPSTPPATPTTTNPPAPTPSKPAEPPSSRLAMTGSSVTGLALLACLCLVTGLVLARRVRTSESKNN